MYGIHVIQSGWQSIVFGLNYVIKNFIFENHQFVVCIHQLNIKNGINLQRCAFIISVFPELGFVTFKFSTSEVKDLPFLNSK